MSTSSSRLAASTCLPAPQRQRLLCMLALLSATLLVALDTTIANTALPQIAINLGATEASIIWVANAYQIAMIAGLLPFAALGESIGYRKVFVGGLITFAVASMLCGMAPTLPILTASRAVQGLGGAAVMSVIIAIIRHIYPPDMLGRGIGLNALFVAVGFTLGPVIASTVLIMASWHWLFFINIPVASVSIALSLRYLPDAAGGRHPFETLAATLCAAFLALLTLGLCSVENGWGAQFALASVALASLCLAPLLRKQRGHPAPMLTVDLLGIRAVRLSSLTSISAFSTQSLALVSLPFLLQHSLGVSVVATGFVLAAWPCVVAVMALVTASLSDSGKFPPGLLCSVGLLLLTAGMWSLAMMPHTTSETGVAIRLALCGAGFGLFQAPNIREIMRKSPTNRSGGASGLVSISRLLGQTCGAATVAQCFHWWQAEGPVMALWLGGGCALLGSLFSVMRLRKTAGLGP